MYDVQLESWRFYSENSKTRKYEEENTKLRRRKHESTMTKVRKHDDEISIIIDLQIIEFSSSCFRIFVIVLSYFRSFVFPRFEITEKKTRWP